MRRFALLIGPIFIYLAFIFFLSSLSAIPGPRIAGIDKLAHAVEYAILGALTVRALIGYRISHAKAVWLAIAFCGLYGLTDELHQVFTPNRQPDVLDLLADVIGGSIGALLWYAGTRRNARSASART
jgi:VanZ family protein